uniref:Uncharacterized protein n=1 Tax=Rhizophora mucronata TaxID=61149 RepID=A0A2P2NFP5_RHIMU
MNWVSLNFGCLVIKVHFF